MEDIVMTERLSGTPCSIIETQYSKRIGYKQNALERLLSKSSLTKKYFKTLVQIRGLQNLEKAVKPGNYNNLWCAGKSSELVTEIKPINKIIEKLEVELTEAFEKHMKSMEKHEKLDRNLGKDMKSSKKQMKSLEKISNADEKCRKLEKHDKTSEKLMKSLKKQVKSSEKHMKSIK